MSIAIAFSNAIFLVFLGLPQGSILCSLIFVIYINNLSNHIVPTIKQLAADDVLFFIVYNAKTLADEINHWNMSKIKLRLEWNGYP